ncbi:hypothetical protein BDP67DRAFT_590065 [Colletotrichum lupini]|nr:hypothetical protein BDP67DRAFT_590065 [Colletotrichum lupini]
MAGETGTALPSGVIKTPFSTWLSQQCSSERVLSLGPVRFTDVHSPQGPLRMKEGAFPIGLLRHSYLSLLIWFIRESWLPIGRAAASSRRRKVPSFPDCQSSQVPAPSGGPTHRLEVRSKPFVPETYPSTCSGMMARSETNALNTSNQPYGYSKKTNKQFELRHSRYTTIYGKRTHPWALARRPTENLSARSASLRFPHASPTGSGPKGQWALQHHRLRTRNAVLSSLQRNTDYSTK